MTESENTPNSHHPRGTFDRVSVYVFSPRSDSSYEFLGSCEALGQRHGDEH